MYGGAYDDRAWIKYSRNIIATDSRSAVFLSSFLSYLADGYEYVSVLEVLDLQRYKVISGKTKVKVALRERGKTPFVFVVGKN